MVPSIKTLRGLTDVAEKCTRGNVEEILQCLRFALQRRDLEECNVLLDGFGVEIISESGRNYCDRMDGSDILASYINMGDTYACTIVFDHTSGRFMVTSWGDWVEWYEARHGRIGDAE